MLTYNFFDYKDYISDEYKHDAWGPAHIIFIIIATLAIILLCVFLRKIKKEKVGIYLKVISIIVPILEVIKIVWESYYDIKLGKGFNFVGLLPLYTCSMFIYVLPIAAWTKGKVQECGLAFLTTIGVFAGLTNFFIPPILNSYPFFSYATFVSLYFHFLMVFTGIFIVTTGYYVPNKKSIIKAFIPLACFSAIVITVDYIMVGLGYPWVDYMLYVHGYGAPILPALSDALALKNLQFLYVMIVMLSYFGIGALFVGIYQLIILIKKMFCKELKKE